MGKVTGVSNTTTISQHAVAVTPSDTVPISAGNVVNAPARVWVGGAGNVSLVTSRGDAVTLIGVTAGSLLPVWVRRVNATNTTATNMVAFY